MDELVARSSDGGVDVALVWSWPVRGSKATAADATRGNLRVRLRGRAVWHGVDETDGFEWTWIELLEFLSEYWLYLIFEEGTPLGVALDTAPRMIAAAEAAIETDDNSGMDSGSDQFEAYRSTHDLAEAVQGAVIPPLWIVRDGHFGWAASTASTARVPFDELIDVLENVGDWIAERLAGVSDNRSCSAVRAWHSREQCNQADAIKITTGYQSELVA